jgi:hypothetical protein
MALAVVRHGKSELFVAFVTSSATITHDGSVICWLLQCVSGCSVLVARVVVLRFYAGFPPINRADIWFSDPIFLINRINSFLLK